MMKTNLLYVNPEQEKCPPYSMKEDMIKDLNLDLVFREMAKNDEFLLSTVKSIMMIPLKDKRDMVYRQGIIEDCFNNREDIEGLYEQIGRTMKQIENYKERVSGQKKGGGALSKTAEIYTSLEALVILLNGLTELKVQISKMTGRFKSEGMCAFLEEIATGYKTEQIDEIKRTVQEMEYLTRGGSIRITTGITDGLKCGGAVVNDIIPIPPKRNVFFRMVRFFYLHFLCKDVVWLKDSALIYQAREMETKGLLHVLEMYQGFIHEMTDFFEGIRSQFGFYLGCVNLMASMKNLGLPYCFPYVSPKENQYHVKDLYDLGLALHTHNLPVSNDLDWTGIKLAVISGANQGGKSTYLRSLGLAQVLMQCGMMVPAAVYGNDIYDNILTHFSRREDQAMNRGRLEEELKRMDWIVKSIRGKSLILLNESFASTTEQDASVIAEDIVRAFFDNGITTYMVTHLYQFVRKMYANKSDSSIFLSAGRKEDGTRTYKMVEEEPAETSYGIDLYDELIGMTN